MADSQNVPVFLRDIDEGEPQFLGRFTVDELAGLVESIKDHQAYTGERFRNDPITQYVCRPAGRDRWIVGFEIILASDETIA